MGMIRGVYQPIYNLLERFKKMLRRVGTNGGAGRIGGADQCERTIGGADHK
jgi:hypothetical protein